MRGHRFNSWSRSQDPTSCEVRSKKKKNQEKKLIQEFLLGKLYFINVGLVYI